MSTADDKDWERNVSNEWAEGLNQIRGEPAPVDSVQRSLAAAERITMTSAAWRRGVKNALICGVLVWSVIGGTACLISVLTQQGGAASLAWAFALYWTIVFSAFLGSWLFGLSARHADELLLDCGPHPTRTLFFLNGVGFGIAGIAADLAGGGWIAKAGTAFFVTFAAYWFIMSTGRLRFYRSGIWMYWTLMRWDKIASTRWHGDSDATLLIQTKARIPLLGRGAVPVAVEQKEAVHRLLLEHLPPDAVSPP